MNKTLIISILLLGFTACQKEIPFDKEQENPRITVNAYMTPDQSFSVLLSESSGILNPELIAPINDAQVEIFENGISQGMLTAMDQGQFTSPLMPTSGSTYRLEASSPGLNDITTTTLLPYPTGIENLTTETILSGGDSIVQVSFDLIDPPGKNQYILLLKQVTGGSDFLLSFSSEEPYFERSGSDNQFAYAMFDDLTFDGTAEQIVLKLGPEYNLGAPTILELVTASSDYFNYLKTSALFDPGFASIFAQPVQIYSNVDQGFGIFCGYSTTTLPIQ